MAVEILKSPRGLVMFSVVSAIVLINLLSTELLAQSENETCPCFSSEEVEAVFVINAGIAEEDRNSECIAEDFKVEIAAEVTALNMDWEPIAKAQVKWADFDPGGCLYINTKTNPPIERKEKWPHPAPEAIARACFDSIVTAISTSDTGSNCDVYP
jgi:hypothetical protein